MQPASSAVNKDDLAKISSAGNDSRSGNASQGTSFFFNQAGIALPLEGAYRDAPAFLIAAGPSFAGTDKSKLHAVWTMTLNNAVASYRGNASCVVDDPSRFNYSMWIDPTIQKFVPLAVMDRRLWDNRLLAVDGREAQRWQAGDVKVCDCPNVVGYVRNEKFSAPDFLHEETINWGCHKRFGGGRSVMLAALRILFLLGFRRVYLLGVDFEMTPEKKYHFPEERPARAIYNNTYTYGRLQGWFAELQPYFLAENFIVRNCNPESKLEAFPYMRFDDAIQEATARLGDYARERTNGMYRRFEDKVIEVKRLAQKSPGASVA